MSTLREMREQGWTISLHCRGYCAHSWAPTWEQLIQYFGQDADFVKDRSGFERLVCEKCGHRGASVIVQPASLKTGAHHGHGPRDPEAEAQAKAAFAEMQEELARAGVKTIAEVNIASREALRAAKKAHKKGDHFIGPPNPFAGRKVFRPPMKG